jgi:2-oxoglutarate dehydrogenase complex dehydrogenase (E1) component-like enzyme
VAEMGNRNNSPNLLRLVHAYRLNGHLMANLDPLNMAEKMKLFCFTVGSKNWISPDMASKMENMIYKA